MCMLNCLKVLFVFIDKWCMWCCYCVFILCCCLVLSVCQSGFCGDGGVCVLIIKYVKLVSCMTGRPLLVPPVVPLRRVLVGRRPRVDGRAEPVLPLQFRRLSCCSSGNNKIDHGDYLTRESFWCLPLQNRQ